MKIDGKQVEFKFSSLNRQQSRASSRYISRQLVKHHKTVDFSTICNSFNISKNELQIQKHKISIVLSKIEKFRIKNNIPIWSHGCRNASEVLKNCTKFESTFDMLTTLLLENDLCLHLKTDDDVLYNSLGMEDWHIREYSYFNSNKTPLSYFETLDISKIDYETFVLSAVCFSVEDLINKNIEPQFIINFIQKISNIFLSSSNSNLGSLICDFLKNIEFCLLFREEVCYGMMLELGCYFYPSYKKNILLDSNLYFTNFFSDLKNIINLSHFLTVLDVFSNKFISSCLKDCVKVSNFIPIYLVLLLYRYNITSISNQDFLKQKNFLIYSGWLPLDFFKKYENNYIDSLNFNNNFTIKLVHDKKNYEISFSTSSTSTRKKTKLIFKIGGNLLKLCLWLALWVGFFLIIGKMALAMQPPSNTGKFQNNPAFGRLTGEATYSRQTGLHDSHRVSRGSRLNPQQTASASTSSLERISGGEQTGQAQTSDVADVIESSLASEIIGTRDEIFTLKNHSVANTTLQPYVEQGWLRVSKYVSNSVQSPGIVEQPKEVIFSLIPAGPFREVDSLAKEIRQQIRYTELSENINFKNVVTFFSGLNPDDMEIDHMFGIFERKATYMHPKVATGILPQLLLINIKIIRHVVFLLDKELI